MTSDAIRILTVGHGEGVVSDIGDRIRDRDGVAIDDLTDVDRLRGRLTAGSRPDCVVVAAATLDGDWQPVLDDVRDVDSHLPIVFLDDEPSSERATAATASGGVSYVDPDAVEPDEIAAQIAKEAERFRSIRQRRSESQQWRSFLEEIPYSVYIKDDEARHVATSAHFEESIDMDPRGKTDIEIWGQDGGDAGVQSYRDDLEVLRTGEPVINRLEVIEPAEGHELWLLTTKLPWRDEDGTVIGLLGISVDITEYKREEQGLRETTERLEQFTSFVSHDLRNPINVAQGYLEHSLATGNEAALERVAQALDQMEDLIDDLLMVTREDDEELKTLPFAPLVERTWRSAATGYLTLELAIPDDTYIVAVPGQLRQLLDNLFRNARDHAGAAVSVRVGITPTGFFVEDDGDGIPEEIREHIFDYGHSETGTGIGLAIVKEIARAHGWETTVTQSPAGGARFEFDHCMIHQGLVQHFRAGDSLEFRTDANVGDSTPTGTYSWAASGDAVTIDGGGEDLYGDTDEHYFLYGEFDRNLRVEARVAEFEGPHEFSKAGIMLRGGPVSGSPFSYIGVSRGHGSETIARPYEGTEIRSEQYDDRDGVPRWYRVDWIDNNAICQTSTDGTDWITLDKRPIKGCSPTYFGFAVCSHDTDQVVRATFDRVRTVELESSRARLEQPAK